MKELIDYQIISKDGIPAFAVLPYAQFLEIYPQAVEDKAGIPHDVVRRIIKDGYSRVRAWREHFGLTQKELAQKMGITQPALSQIESPDAKLRPATIEKLVKVLAIPADYLV